MEQDIIKYIKDNLRKGYSLSAIRSSLISSGKKPEEINPILNKFTPARSPFKIIITVAVIAVLLVIIFFSFQLYMKKQQEYSILSKELTEKIITDCFEKETVIYDIYSFLKGDISLCDKSRSIEGCKDAYYFLSAADKDFADCSFIPEGHIKNACNGIAAKNPSKCNVEDETFCEAIINNDADLCKKDSETEIDCNNIFYNIKALNTGNASECGNMKSFLLDHPSWINNQKQKCLYLVNGNPAKIEEDIAKRCYEDEIVATLNMHSCDYVPEQYKDSCYKRIAVIMSCLKDGKATEPDKKMCISEHVDLSILCGEDGSGGPSLDSPKKKALLDFNMPGLCSIK